MKNRNKKEYKVENKRIEFTKDKKGNPMFENPKPNVKNQARFSKMLI